MGSDSGRTQGNAANKRTEKWLSARDWFARGAVPSGARLAEELTAPIYGYDAKNVGNDPLRTFDYPKIYLAGTSIAVIDAAAQHLDLY